MKTNILKKLLNLKSISLLAVITILIGLSMHTPDLPDQLSKGNGAPVCTEPPANMVSWWPLDGNSNDIVDSNPGQVVGGAGYVQGEVLQAIGLDGQNDYVSVANKANLNPTAAISVDAWVKFTNLEQGPTTIVSKLSNNLASSDPNNLVASPNLLVDSRVSVGGYALSYKTHLADSVSFAVYINGGLQVASFNKTLLTAGNWHHITGTYDGTNVRIYLDGTQHQATPIVGAINPSNEPLFIGAEPDQGNPKYFFNGAIDEVEIFSRALGLQEIQNIFAARTAGKCKCGNNVLDKGETCDDGNTNSGDGCSNLCQIEGLGKNTCGNSIKEGSEQCDDGNTKNDDDCSTSCKILTPSRYGRNCYNCEIGEYIFSRNQLERGLTTMILTIDSALIPALQSGNYPWILSALSVLDDKIADIYTAYNIQRSEANLMTCIENQSSSVYQGNCAIYPKCSACIETDSFVQILTNEQNQYQSIIAKLQALIDSGKVTDQSLTNRLTQIVQKLEIISTNRTQIMNTAQAMLDECKNKVKAFTGSEPCMQ